MPIKATVKLLPQGPSLIEMRATAPGEAALEKAFDWSLGRYGQTYADLARRTGSGCKP